MTITKMTIKFLGKKETVYRVLDASGEVLHVACSAEDAAAWVSAN